jgi:hypothetical protein
MHRIKAKYGDVQKRPQKCTYTSDEAKLMVQKNAQLGRLGRLTKWQLRDKILWDLEEDVNGTRRHPAAGAPGITHSSSRPSTP